jgi:hypothetical protein
MPPRERWPVLLVWLLILVTILLAVELIYLLFRLIGLIG